VILFGVRSYTTLLYGLRTVGRWRCPYDYESRVIGEVASDVDLWNGG
jgi:hypothetical protein